MSGLWLSRLFFTCPNELSLCSTGTWASASQLRVWTWTDSLVRRHLVCVCFVSLFGCGRRVCVTVCMLQQRSFLLCVCVGVVLSVNLLSAKRSALDAPGVGVTERERLFISMSLIHHFTWYVHLRKHCSAYCTFGNLNHKCWTRRLIYLNGSLDLQTSLKGFTGYTPRYNFN